jgi:hypothetical protein
MFDVISWCPKPIRDLVRPEEREWQFGLGGDPVRLSKTAVRVATVMRMALAGVSTCFFLTALPPPTVIAVVIGLGNSLVSRPIMTLTGSFVAIFSGYTCLKTAIVYHSALHLAGAAVFFLAAHYFSKHYMIGAHRYQRLENEVIVPYAISIANRWDSAPQRA